MIEPHQLAAAVDRIVERDPRYAKAAYFFTHRAVCEVGEAISKKENGVKRQITGKELLEGIRDFAIEQFGPLTLTVFNNWNITSSRDFGNIVFNLVDERILWVTDDDSIEDFEGVYEFHDVFGKPYEPKQRRLSRISLEALEEGRLDISLSTSD